MPDPVIPEDVTFSMLDREVRGRLRTLSKDNADRAGRHLVMVGRLLDEDAEAAYEHAQAAVRRAGRVDVVREAAGLAAYRTGRYAEALRELRTVRRLNGSSEHLAVMADAERGLGRPERAIALSQEPEAETLPADTRIEMAIVVSGARLDLGQPEAAVAALSTPLVRAAGGLVAARVAQARAAALEAAGRAEEAAAELAAFPKEMLDEAAGNLPEHDDDGVVVYDLADEEEGVDAPDDAADRRDDGDVDESGADSVRGAEPDEDAPAGAPGAATQDAADAQDESVPDAPGAAASESGLEAPITDEDAR